MVIRSNLYVNFVKILILKLIHARVWKNIYQYLLIQLRTKELTIKKFRIVKQCFFFFSFFLEIGYIKMSTFKENIAYY